MRKTETPIKLTLENITTEDYLHVEVAADKVLQLTGIPQPKLEIQTVAAKAEKLFDVPDTKALAYKAFEAGDITAANDYIHLLAVEHVKHEGYEDKLRQQIIRDSEHKARSKDVHTLAQYVADNIDAARAKFNQYGGEFAQNRKTQFEELWPYMNAGLKLTEALNKVFGWTIPERTHPITANNFYPARPNPWRSPILSTDPAYIITLADTPARPGSKVQFYWKSIEEFAAEGKLFEKLIKSVGSISNNDIKIYEYWLSQK